MPTMQDSEIYRTPEWMPDDLKRKFLETYAHFLVRERAERAEADKRNAVLRKQRYDAEQIEIAERRARVILDETTGLPELPEGYYWRIGMHEDEYSRDLFAVMLMRKRTDMEDMIVALAYNYTTNEGQILTDAQDLAIKWLPRFAEHARQIAVIEKYSGDYPPKAIAITDGSEKNG